MSKDYIKYEKIVVVIIDGYSGGRYLAPAFKARGYDSIHIQTISEIPEVYKKSFIPSDYILNIIENNIDVIVNILKDYKIKCIIDGSELCVGMADLILQQLNLPHNDTSLIEHRRNKFLMQERLKECGLNYIPQFYSKNISEILDYYEKSFINSVVVKPLKSSMGDNVYFCKNKEDVQKSCSSILESQNIFTEVNNGILIQKYIEGEEYVINTVSCDGKHFISDIWKVHKKNNTASYDYCEIMQKDYCLAYDDLVNYSKKVLDALAIKNAASHIEVKYSGNNVILIEIGVRLMGASYPSFESELFGGNTQVSLLVDSIVNQKAFLKRSIENCVQNGLYGLNVHLVSDINGRISEFDIASFLKKIPSVHSFIISPSGKEIKAYSHLCNFIGIVYLINSNRETLYLDMKHIREVEKEKFYVR